MQNDLKIIVVGPPKSGKTELADLLSAASKNFQGNCKPTIALRILEFTTTISFTGLQNNISVQLWDTSGDEKYSACWPAIAKDADGCMIVYNAHDKNHGKQVESYIKKFASDLKSAQCFVVAHRIGECEGKPMRPKLPKAYEDTQISMINAKDALDQFADNFNDFLGRVQQEKIKRIEEKERELIGDISSNKKKSRPAKHEVEEEPETLDIGDDDDGGDDE